MNSIRIENISLSSSTSFLISFGRLCWSWEERKSNSWGLEREFGDDKNALDKSNLKERNPSYLLYWFSLFTNESYTTVTKAFLIVSWESSFSFKRNKEQNSFESWRTGFFPNKFMKLNFVFLRNKKLWKSLMDENS